MIFSSRPPSPPGVKTRTEDRAGLTWDGLLFLATSFLASKGVEEAHLEAQSLLCYHLGWSRAELYIHSREKTAPQVESRFWQLIHRRGQGEPTAYIRKHREFFGLDFYVDPRVFIPRPETELLVGEALKLVAGYPPAGLLLLADIGTGSGAIAISLAVNLPWAHIYATDISPGALEVAGTNSCRHGVENRVHLLLGDMLEPLPQPCHLIVANLPYIPRRELDGLSPEVAAFEPGAALNGGEDGLDPIRRFLAQVGPRLRPGGSFLLEIGQGQGEAATRLAREHFPRAQVTLLPDPGAIDRALKATPAGHPSLQPLDNP